MSADRSRKPLGDLLLAGLATAVLGAGSMLLVQVSRDLSLTTTPFRFQAGAGDSLEVTASEPLEIPAVYGDMDLSAEVELAAGTELDLVFRKVEPRRGDRRFHGRFDVLRLSTVTAGAPYRSREEALFGDGSGGVSLAPGVPASLRLEARGRRVRAWVAGRWFPWIETVDDHGSAVFAARGGNVVLRRLEIVPVGRPGVSWHWILAVALCLTAGALLAARGATARRLAAMLLVPVGAALSAAVVLVHLQPLAAAEPRAQLLLAMWTLPLALAAGWRPRRARYLAAAALMSLLALEIGARSAAPQLEPFEDPRLSLHFGPGSGGAPLDALIGRMSSVTSVDYGGPAACRVLFLGGRHLYEPATRDRLFADDLDDREILAELTSNALRDSLGSDVVGTVVPTWEARAFQQLLLLQTFYMGFSPRALVFAVTAAELEPIPGGEGGHRPLEQGSGHREPDFALLELLVPDRREPGGADELGATLGELAKLCREQDIAAVVMVEASLPGRLLEVARTAAAAGGMPLCVQFPLDDGATRARRLHDALLPGLR